MKQKKAIAFVLSLAMLLGLLYGSGFTLSAMAEESKKAFDLKECEFTVKQDNSVSGSATVSTSAAVTTQQGMFVVTETELKVTTGNAVISSDVTVEFVDLKKSEMSNKDTYTYQLTFGGYVSSQNIKTVYLYYQVKKGELISYQKIGEMTVRSPSEVPTAPPTDTSTGSPSEVPTAPPTDTSTGSPSEVPTAPPTDTSTAPSTAPPTAPSTAPPTATPTELPSGSPSITPTVSPTVIPTKIPSEPSTEPPALIPTGPAVIEPTPVPSRQPVTVKKTVSVTLGKSLAIGKIVSDPSAFEKMTLPKAKKYHKYFRINGKTGKITTRKNYSVTIKKKIKVKVWLRGVKKPYTVQIKIKIPKPKVKIKVKNYTYRGIHGYHFSFYYHLKKDSKLKVRLAKDGTAEINRIFDKYISGRKSNKNTYIRFTRGRIKRNGNKITFKIAAQYGKGKNKSQTLKIKMKKNKKGKWKSIKM